MSSEKLTIILCNDAKLPNGLRAIRNKTIFPLNYDRRNKDTRVFIGLPKFVDDVNHLSENVKDLLEIAAFVYAADRNSTRGANDQVEFQSWSRNLHFVIKVRDHKFWNNKETKRALIDTLEFVSGDKRYDFTFVAGRVTGKYNFFDENTFRIQPRKKTNIVLFSGGLDSLAGILETLSNTNHDVCLISHRSGQGSNTSTRKKILEKLETDFPNRCRYFEFQCHLKGKRAIEESQRTRSFLYTSIAYALSTAYSSNKIHYYENGITSINFLDSQDLINARASRTTHPKTIGLMNILFRRFNSNFLIEQPYLLKTKSDVVNIIKSLNRSDYIGFSVSCSKTFKTVGEHSHCGGCSQCIDRKFAIYNLGLEEFDENVGLYSFNFITEKIEDGAIRKTLLDYVRLALLFSELNYNNFEYKMVEQLSDIVDFMEGLDDLDKSLKIYNLCKVHGAQIENAIVNMQKRFHSFFKRDVFEDQSLLQMLFSGEQFRKPVERIVECITIKVSNSIPKIFRKNNPKDENDLNDKIEGILSSEKLTFEREFPTITFALAKTIPDHSNIDSNLLIETKYLRGTKPLSAITDELGADLVKYQKFGEDVHILFLVYDPERKIHDDEKFKSDFKNHNCTIELIR